jgi:hypothetical protein
VTVWISAAAGPNCAPISVAPSQCLRCGPSQLQHHVWHRQAVVHSAAVIAQILCFRARITAERYQIALVDRRRDHGLRRPNRRLAGGRRRNQQRQQANCD